MRLIVAVLALVSSAGALAADPPAAPPTIVISGLVTDHNPFVAAGSRSTFPATIYLRGEHIRVDFRGPAGERGLLLHDGVSGIGWLADLSRGHALPTDAAARSFGPLRVDALQPCARMGTRCEAAAPRFIAGRSRKGYRFRDAAGRGPGQLDSGEFWVDHEHGVIVAYRGTGRGARQAPAMEAHLVVRDQLPDEVFALPEVVRLPDPPSAR